MYRCATVGAEAAARGMRIEGVFRFVAKIPVEWIGFLSIIRDIKFGITVFTGSIFEVVNGVAYADDDKQHAEQREDDADRAEALCHRGGKHRPEDAENDAEYRAKTTHHGGAAAGFDAFHVTPPAFASS